MNEKYYGNAIVVLIALAPFGLWKVVELAIWVANHLRLDI